MTAIAAKALLAFLLLVALVCPGLLQGEKLDKNTCVDKLKSANATALGNSLQSCVTFADTRQECCIKLDGLFGLKSGAKYSGCLCYPDLAGTGVSFATSPEAKAAAGEAAGTLTPENVLAALDQCKIPYTAKGQAKNGC